MVAAVAPGGDPASAGALSARGVQTRRGVARLPRCGNVTQLYDRSGSWSCKRHCCSSGTFSALDQSKNLALRADCGRCVKYRILPRTTSYGSFRLRIDKLKMSITDLPADIRDWERSATNGRQRGRVRFCRNSGHRTDMRASRGPWRIKRDYLRFDMPTGFAPKRPKLGMNADLRKDANVRHGRPALRAPLVRRGFVGHAAPSPP